jgi:hypothetical protein
MMLRNKPAVPLHSQLALTIGEQVLRAVEIPSIYDQSCAYDIKSMNALSPGGPYEGQAANSQGWGSSIRGHL